MTQEALKQALEALESHIVWFSRDTMIGKSMREKTDKAIAAIKEALAAQPEPNLLGYWLTGTQVVEFSHSDYHDGPEWQPVYTTPPAAQPAPVQEPVAWGVFDNGDLYEMFFSKEQAEHISRVRLKVSEVRPLYTPPAAQRKPLTDEQRMCSERTAADAYAYATAAYADAAAAYATADAYADADADAYKEGCKVGRAEAFEQIAEKVKEMPWESDTKDSFLVWLQEQNT